LHLQTSLARKDAHVSIVARMQSKLDSTLKELEVRMHNQTTVHQVFFPLDTAEESAAALQFANDAHAVHLPDTVFSYAGTTKLVYLLDMQVEDLTR
ncbi:hypothetical protein DFH29DRAFT_819155, partial [Suillus ampliporus]